MNEHRRTADQNGYSSPTPGLYLPWCDLVDQVIRILHDPQRQHDRPVSGLLILRAKVQPQMLRLTHEAGLALQAAIARRITEVLRDSDQVFALDNWEWLLVLPACTSSTPVVLAMMKIQRQLSDRPFLLPGLHTPINFLIGAAIFPDSGDDPQHLIQSARIAAMAADQMPDRYAVYDKTMERTGDSDLSQHEALKSAISSNTLKLYLQPQIDVATRHCHHAEALLRWQLPDGTDIPAPSIIAMVEQDGLRPRFNRWLVQQGVQSLARLEESGIRINISLNLTANDLLDPELPDLVQHTLAFWRVEPDRVLFEITETIVVADTDDVAQTLNRLRKLGVRLAIDDFGTGYAGMSYLSRLPISEVKIDQSFIRRINESSTDYEIIASVTTLAHRLGMEIVAEGVESEEVFAAVKSLGCDRVQGFLFARALPEQQFAEWWRTHHRPA